MCDTAVVSQNNPTASHSTMNATNLAPKMTCLALWLKHYFSCPP